MMNILITDPATNKITEILESEADPKACLRIYIEGGGCSGFSYGFAIDNEVNEDDFTVRAGSRSILVDGMSAQYLSGATIDYVESLQGANFKIKNPNSTGSCGCGSSFSM